MERVGLGRWALALALVVVGSGCQSKSDLGTECTLVRRNPDGGEPITVTNAEVQPGQEWISDGVTTCENLVCVRDADFPADTQNPSGPAKGYCSTPCSPTTDNGPSLNEVCPAANPVDNQEGSPNHLSCRRMSLDEETIAAWCQADPANCERIIGQMKSSFFCARGDGQPGAGTP